MLFPYGDNVQSICVYLRVRGMTGKRHKGTSRALKMMHILFWVVVTLSVCICKISRTCVRKLYVLYDICYTSRKSKKGVQLLMKCPTVLQCLINMTLLVKMVSDQISRSVVSDSLRPHESQHARPPCPSPTPGVHGDSRPSSQ